MSEAALPLFEFEGQPLRVHLDEAGEPWFVAKDVLKTLGYAGDYNPSRALQAVPGEWKGVQRMHTLGGAQDMLTLSEPGLYFFVARSDKPRALPFQKWLAGEVLPSLRRLGRYEMPGRSGSQPVGLSAAALRLRPALRERILGSAMQSPASWEPPAWPRWRTSSAAAANWWPARRSSPFCLPTGKPA